LEHPKGRYFLKKSKKIKFFKKIFQKGIAFFKKVWYNNKAVSEMARWSSG
jgi:hypothetical protein